MTRKRRVRWLLAAAVALMTIAVYLPVLRNDFINWDDDLYVYNNLQIRSLGLSFFRWAVSDYSVSYWHPITWISHAVDYALWGLNPAGHHLTSVVLHALNAVLVFWLTVRLIETARGTRTTLLPAEGKSDGPFRGVHEQGILTAAGVAGMLFGLHPLHVESVAWVAERKDLLCALFFMLSILSYIRYASAPKRAGRRNGAGEDGREGAPAPGTRWCEFLRDGSYLLSLVFFVLASASKPMAVTLPAVLLILDYYPLRRFDFRQNTGILLAEKIPYAAIGLALAAVTFIAQRSIGAVMPLESFPISTRVLVAVESLFVYLRQMAVPLQLLPLYPYPEDVSWWSLRFLLPAIFFGGMTALSIITAKKRGVILSVWGYYCVTLLPVLGLVQLGVQYVADRYCYLPSIGPFLLVGLASAWASKKSDALKKGGVLAKGALLFAAALITLGMVHLTTQQIALRKDSITLWSHVIEKEPSRLYIAYNNRGVAFRDAGMHDRALKDYASAIALAPFDSRPYTNRGIAYGEAGQFELAEADLTTAINMDPRDADALTARGLVYERTGRLADALQDYEAALRIRPASVEAYMDRGVVFERMNLLDRAIEDYGRAAALNPRDPLAYRNRGGIFAKTGRLDSAVADLTKALSLKPDYAEAYLERAQCYLRTGDRASAKQDYQRACALGNEQGCRALRSGSVW